MAPALPAFEPVGSSQVTSSLVEIRDGEDDVVELEGYGRP
jgi:hypothetical protein